MSETFPRSCVCGGSVDRPNDDCERCRMQAALAAAKKENAALTAEVERLRKGIQATVDYVLTGVHCRMADHMTDSCDCQKIGGEFEKLIAQPKGGPDA